MKNKTTNFGEYLRPSLYELMKAIRLDVEYIRGSGDYLYYKNDKGEDVPVLDLAGGFGSTILGHNHPEIKELIQDALNREIPMHAQGSLRETAGRLGAKLSSLYPGREKRMVIFTNSGTEAVEAALKHAELNRVKKLMELGKAIYRNYSEIKEFHKMNSKVVLPKEYREKGFDAMIGDILMQTKMLETMRPIVICTEKSFHGKTSSALRITGNPMYREAFKGLSGIDARFVEFNNLIDLENALAECYFTIRKLKVEGNEIKIYEEFVLNVTAFIIEPIQGEGGIHIATQNYMRGIQKLKEKYGFEWILDEIQSGMGRTGKLFAMEHFKFDYDEVDYVTLSKSLGGGTHKIGALLIRDSVHDPDFGILHTSTFCEDSVSSMVGIKVLDLLTRDNGKMMKGIASRGKHFLLELNKLKEEYPDVIRDVRGLGLIIGLEFDTMDNNSALTFQRMGQQGVMGSVLSGYMLYEHRIRTAPPLNSLVSKKPSNIIRIEPSAKISSEDIDRTVAALKRACEIIRRCNGYELTKFVVHKETPGSEHEPKDFRHIDTRAQKHDPEFDNSRRMAFLVHPLDINQVCEDFDPSLQQLGAEKDPKTGITEREQYWNTLVPLLDTFIYRIVNVRSPRTGDMTRAHFIGFLYTTKQMVHLRKNDHNSLVSRLQQGVDLGVDLGAQIVGLGAFTSIVTHNGTDLDDTYVRITSGNSYTSALIWQSVLKAANYMDLELGKSTCAIVGAGGNIGSVTASLLAEDTPNLILIGRDRWKSTDDLKKVAYTIYSDCVDILRTTRPEKLKGLPAALAADLMMPYAALMQKELRFDEEKITEFIEQHYSGKDQKIASLIRSIFFRRPDHDIGEKIFQAIQLKHGKDPYVILTTNAKKHLPNADIVVSAVSADTAIIDPKWIKPGAIINDASLPPSISNEIYDKRPDVLAIQGGIGHLPEYIDLGIPGLAAGATLGCMAETFILTMMNMVENFSYGKITKQQVVKIWEAGEILGFGLAAIKFRNNQKLTRELAKDIKNRSKSNEK